MFMNEFILTCEDFWWWNMWNACLPLARFFLETYFGGAVLPQVHFCRAADIRLYNLCSAQGTCFVSQVGVQTHFVLHLPDAHLVWNCVPLVGHPFLILIKVLSELAWPCGFGTVVPAVTRPYSSQALQIGLVIVGPGALQEFSPCELLMGREWALPLHYQAQLNQRVQLKIVKFVMGVEKCVQNKQFERYHYLWKDNEKEIIEKTEAPGKRRRESSCVPHLLLDSYSAHFEGEIRCYFFPFLFLSTLAFLNFLGPEAF